MCLAEKLCRVSEECGYVQKDAANAFHKYRYASAATILAHVNASLARNRVAVVGVAPSIVAERGEGKERVVTARVELIVADADSDERATFAGLGSGQDAGDKAVMKAVTAATKYAWMVALSISTGDDPEADEDTDERSAGRSPKGAAPKAPSERELAAMAAMLRAAPTLAALKAAWGDMQEELARATDAQRAQLAAVKDTRKAALVPTTPPDGTSGPRRGPGPVASAEGAAAEGAAPVAMDARAYLEGCTVRAHLEAAVRKHGKDQGRAWLALAAQRLVAISTPADDGTRLALVCATQAVEVWAHEGPRRKRAA